VHNNYFFLNRLANYLNGSFKGFRFGEIFSQNKDELIIGLYQTDKSFYIKADLSPQFSCLSFPENFSRSKKNSVDLFNELLDQTIIQIKTSQNDRSMQFICENYVLVFKLYGNRSNVLVFKGNDCIRIFKKKFDKDCLIQLNNLDKKHDLSFDNFQRNIDNLNRFIPTLGKENMDFFLQKNKSISNEKELWEKLIEFIDNLQTNKIRITTENDLPRLVLYNNEKEGKEYNDPVKALNDFYNEYIKQHHLSTTKHQLRQELHSQIKKRENYIIKGEKKLSELIEGVSYHQMADIVMANLHQIKGGLSEVELFDFYQNKNILIKLKKDLSPQKNAENYYRKGKNQKIEINKLKENLETKKQELLALKAELMVVSQADNLKDLKTIKKKESKPENLNLPYHSLPAEGFYILVGKNARRNDELTFKIAHKNDLWLHAKDSPGSHVIIRQKPGQKFTANVIEKAASLAAFFSKRKTESMVPVSYTERKFVRKTKDLLPGQVILEKESVILAEPVNWLEKD